MLFKHETSKAVWGLGWRDRSMFRVLVPLYGGSPHVIARDMTLLYFVHVTYLLAQGGFSLGMSGAFWAYLHLGL